ncbi:universal stress protein [Halobellus sp. GM3]|uniref:universal stress protein n=1 Tax=Halobellus sp. GM3 TaxID=3458410 RepID=UPI00403DCAEC
MSDPDPLFARPLLPVANDDDAERTLSIAFPRVAAAAGRATVVHVIEKAGGAPDKAPLEQREEAAEALFGRVREAADDAGVDVETELRYGTDVAQTIIDTARDADATAIVFTPRSGRKWWDFFSGDVRETLTTDSDIPVVVLPSGDADSETDGGMTAETEPPDEPSGGEAT